MRRQCTLANVVAVVLTISATNASKEALTSLPSEATLRVSSASAVAVV